jgi:phosphate/sulfate permease
VERVTTECASAITDVIAEDTGLPTEAAHLLAVGLVGMGQVSARYWLNDPGLLSREDATALIAGLAWRGIGGYPLH